MYKKVVYPESYAEKVKALKNVIGTPIFPFVWEDDCYHGMAGKYHVWTFVNDVSHEFDVCVDSFNANGTEANVEWLSFENPQDALNCFLKFYYQYLNA